jgi:hypothetical protein
MSSGVEEQLALPTYQPSTVLSQTHAFSATTVVSRSRDSVEKVGAFYRDALARGGWQTVAASTTLPWSTHLAARRGQEGVTIQISSIGLWGCSISVSTYPV